MISSSRKRMGGRWRAKMTIAALLKGRERTEMRRKGGVGSGQQCLPQGEFQLPVAFDQLLREGSLFLVAP